MTGCLVKVCGLKFLDNLKQVLELEPDYVGFIFTPLSPRCVFNGDISIEDIATITQAKTVGVFVDEAVERVLDLANQGVFDAIQLHGDESVEYIGKLRGSFSGEVWKALSVKESLPSYARYEKVCDRLLFDTYTEQGGGSGEKFSWELLPKESHRPYFLAGGVSPHDAALVKERCHHTQQLCGVDLNSRFETEPGRKDPSLLSSFLEELRI